ncbi:MAG: ABC transporter substrate-binding protein [Desulfurococcaceae archaeon]
MSSYRILALVLFVIIVFSIIMPLVTIAQEVKTGPRSDRIVIRRYKIEDVPSAIQAGDIDVYIYSLRPAQAEQLRGIPGVKLISAPAGLNEFTLNPAPVHVERIRGKLTAREVAARFGVPVVSISNLYYEEENGVVYTVAEFGAFPGKGINPFAFREIRFAMNYLVDRSQAVGTIMRGFAVPMVTFLSEYDPEYAMIADIVAKYEFKYDPDYARSIVDKVLNEVGAVKKAGKWYYDDKPITLNFVIRQEDERRDMGYMFSAELKLLGFEVNEKEMRFAEAIPLIYGTDPKEHQWHIYTAGWGKGAFVRYDDIIIAQFCAPWYGNMPGWGYPEFWNYRNDTIDELSLRIYQGNYMNKEEREQMYRTATEMCIQESVRIWILTRLDTNVAREEVKGITVDLGAGLRGIWNLREMYIEGRNELRVGHLWAWTASSIWNWWGGFMDVYSVDPARATYDPMTWTNPFNGEIIPFRTSYVVQTAGPTGKLDVPTTALIWDPVNNKWINVTPGTKATSKVVFDLSKVIGTKFHNGFTITWSDVIGYLALYFDLIYDPTYSKLEPRIVSSSKPTLDMIKGLEFDIARNRLVVYIDYWHFDENFIASMASIFGFGNPLEIHVATFELALDRRAETRYVLYEITGYKGISLVVPEHVADIKATLLKYKNNAEVLEKVKALTNGLMTMSEWNSRIDATIAWIDTYGNAWISYGPYKLVKLDTVNQEIVLEAFRDPTYPFKPGDWYFGTPLLTEITKVSIESPLPGKILPGSRALINVDVSGLTPLYLKYIIKDPAGNIVAFASAVNVTPTRFQIELTPEITTGMSYGTTYTLILVATSDVVAMPAVRREVVSVATLAEVLSLQREEFAKALSEYAGKTTREIEELAATFNMQLAETQRLLQAQISALQAQVNATLAGLGEAFASTLVNVLNMLGQVSNATTSSIASLSELVSGTTKTTIELINATGISLSSEIKDLKSKIDTMPSDVTNRVMSQVGSSIDELKRVNEETRGTVSMLQTLVVVNMVLSIVAIALVTMLLLRRK